MPSVIDFNELRADWYANANFMARALQRELSGKPAGVTFVAFPRQWIVLFEWVGAAWRDSSPPSVYVPFLSNLSEAEVLSEIVLAKRSGQLRLLVEVAASSEVVLCETLQRIDGLLGYVEPPETPTTLTTWHGYNRFEFRKLDQELASFKATRDKVIFIPCAKARPYTRSPSHQRLLDRLRDNGLDPDDYEKVVLTSIGPIPEALWEHDVVLSYDTGVRDLYRLLVQLRGLLKGNSFSEAWDFLPLKQYGDLLDVLHLEGALPMLIRPSGLRRRNIPIYRTLKGARA